jgi:hypothetical protein
MDDRLYHENYYHDSAKAAGTVSTVFMRADSALEPSMRYTLHVRGVKDEYDNVLNTEYRVSFATAGGPRALFTSPPNDAKNVRTNKPVRVYFNSLLDSASLEGHVYMAHGSDGPVAATLTYYPTSSGEEDGSVSYVEITPASNLQASMDYTIYVTGVRDILGFTMQTVYTSTFWTGYGPSLLYVSPTGGSHEVLATARASASFNKYMDPASLQTGFTMRDRQGNQVSGTVTYDAMSMKAYFTPDAPLAFGGFYSAHIVGAKDTDGNVMPAYSWGFTVVSLPQVTAVSPPDHSTNQPPSSKISATFD